METKTMSKTKIYLIILAITIIAIAAGYIMNIQIIKTICASAIAYAKKPALSVTAAVCAFLFLGNKNYWLIIAGCAIVTSLTIQYLVIGHGAALFTVAVRACTFIAIVYLMNLVKLIFNEA